jgi:hypothetical protein
VVTAKRTQVEKVAKTIIATNTVALKIETTNKFKNQNCWSVKADKTGSRTPCPS